MSNEEKTPAKRRPQGRQVPSSALLPELQQPTFETPTEALELQEEGDPQGSPKTVDYDVVLQLMNLIAQQAYLVPIDAIEACLRELDHIDSVMPIVDPTAYRNIMRNIPSHRAMMQAFLAFRKVIGEVSKPR